MNWKLRKQSEALLAREQGPPAKVWGSALSVCLVYPNSYRAGMANLGFQAVYKIINEHPSFLCERAFLSAAGGGAESAAVAAEAISLESRKPLGEFDIVAFSVSFENDYSHLLKILDAAGLPLKSADRSESHPLVLGGGVAFSINPEPMADFIDVFLLGEAEEGLPRFCDLFDGAKAAGRPRRELLVEMQKSLAGVYVPSLYRVKYAADGTTTGVEPLAAGLPACIRVRAIKRLDGFSTEEVISAPDTEMSEMYLVEVNRGCPRRCLFCAAGHLYAPVRFRRLDDLAPALDRGLARKNRIGLVGTAVSDHPELLAICRYILDRGGKVGIGSLRADRIDAPMVSILVESGIETVALAPEAGSERLRAAVCKDLSDRKIIEAALSLLAGGILQLRLYFMVGLPTEQETDIDAIIDLVKKIQHEALFRTEGRKKFRRITLSINQFIPKPRTPFERHPLADIAEVARKIHKVVSAFRRDKQISVIHDVPKWNYVQALLALGDRRVGDILLSAHAKNGNWPRALKAVHINPDFYVYREKLPDEILPWDHIEIGKRSRMKTDC